MLCLIVQVFTSLSLFLMLISPLNAFPWVINGLVEAWVSLKRVENFCSLREADLQYYYSPMTGTSLLFTFIILLSATLFMFCCWLTFGGLFVHTIINYCWFLNIDTEKKPFKQLQCFVYNSHF